MISLQKSKAMSNAMFVAISLFRASTFATTLATMRGMSRWTGTGRDDKWSARSYKVRARSGWSRGSAQRGYVGGGRREAGPPMARFGVLDGMCVTSMGGGLAMSGSAWRRFACIAALDATRATGTGVGVASAEAVVAIAGGSSLS